MLKLKDRPDGVGYIYGIFDQGNGYHLRVDLMPPGRNTEFGDPELWTAYIDGEKIGCYNDRPETEKAVIKHCEDQA